MAYTKTTWQNNVTDIDENNLNKIEKGIYDNSIVVEAIKDTINPTDTETYKTAELTEGQITDVIGVNDIIIKGQTSQNGEPTPSSPVDVNVVSGSNVIRTSNKNFLDISKLVTQTIYGVKVTKNKDMSITLNGTSTNAFAIDIPLNNIILEKNTKYIFSKKNNMAGAFYSLSLRDNADTSTIVYSLDSAQKTLEINSNTKQIIHCLKLYVPKDRAFTNHTFYPMLELGETETTYKPHQGKELPLDLGSIELCKIGDYQDYFYKSGSKWYLHKEINKITSYNGKTITTSYISTTGELSTGAKVYYVVNSTNTEITDTTLISQLEAIYNAPLYEQTNITQENNDLPIVLDITACKDNINGIKAFIRK